MAGGRPRTVSFEPEEMIALGKEMVAWVEEHNPLHLSEFYCLHKGFIESEWETMIRRPEFVGYYQQAMKNVGKNYLNGTVNPSIAQRFLRLYFKDLRDEENETLKYKADLEKEVVDSVPNDIREGQQALMNQLKAMQSNKVQPITND